ncbi:hypothetical protein DCAR_0101067 [Daucus carota subsp. sativus]|uniref:Uncharacterized protein n=1 Tax=Daucus carota subsp. sativus TaxID=79200 RepID=A0A175YBU0_DAUCS|nr:hypothetical protein DCAR_0101067 [Daucus carota subsp. sativus]
MHENNLTGNWILSIRNGYKIPVAFDAENRKLVGVGEIFSDFGLVGGEDCNEIQYPAIVHSSHDTSPVAVSSNDGGWKFVQFISVAHPTMDKVVFYVSDVDIHCTSNSMSLHLTCYCTAMVWWIDESFHHFRVEIVKAAVLPN